MILATLAIKAYEVKSKLNSAKWGHISSLRKPKGVIGSQVQSPHFLLNYFARPYVSVYFQRCQNHLPGNKVSAKSLFTVSESGN